MGDCSLSGESCPEQIEGLRPGRAAAYRRGRRHLGLRFAAVATVARGDLADGGAWLVAETIRQALSRTPGVGVEMLSSDFGYGQGPAKANPPLDLVVEARPDAFAFTLETAVQ